MQPIWYDTIVAYCVRANIDPRVIPEVVEIRTNMVMAEDASFNCHHEQQIFSNLLQYLQSLNFLATCVPLLKYIKSMLRVKYFPCVAVEVYYTFYKLYLWKANIVQELNQCPIYELFCLQRSIQVIERTVKCHDLCIELWLCCGL